MYNCKPVFSNKCKDHETKLISGEKAMRIPDAQRLCSVSAIYPDEKLPGK